MFISNIYCLLLKYKMIIYFLKINFMPKKAPKKPGLANCKKSLSEARPYMQKKFINCKRWCTTVSNCYQMRTRSAMSCRKLPSKTLFLKYIYIFIKFVSFEKQENKWNTLKCLRLIRVS